jgi:hypothetical protein
MSNAVEDRIPDVDSLPLVSSKPLSLSEERLVAQFEKTDLRSLESLSEAGKRLVEWGTAAVGVFFAALALLQNPAVLDVFSRTETKVIGMVAVGFYLVAILMGYIASVPMRYSRRRYSIEDMKATYSTALKRKYWLVVSGSAFFALGTVALGAVIMMILINL